jgi:hypothetical protein
MVNPGDFLGFLCGWVAKELAPLMLAQQAIKSIKVSFNFDDYHVQCLGGTVSSTSGDKTRQRSQNENDDIQTVCERTRRTDLDQCSKPTIAQSPLYPSAIPYEREVDMDGRPSSIWVHHPPAVG